jgi:hypothetical protein
MGGHDDRGPPRAAPLGGLYLHRALRHPSTCCILSTRSSTDVQASASAGRLVRPDRISLQTCLHHVLDLSRSDTRTPGSLKGTKAS